MSQAKSKMNSKKQITKNDGLTPSKLRHLGGMKGFEYALPNRQEEFRYIGDKCRLVAKSFGYREVDGPLLQPIEFYAVKSGDDLLQHTYVFTDQSKKRIY